MINIRNETPQDYEIVENITRKAFYNVYIPGCVEHYLVHIMRDHEDCISELDFVIEVDGRIIGNVMYTKSKLNDENNKQKYVLTFGPLGVLPEYQRQGYGKMLLEHSFKKATELGYDTIVIFGSPNNYISRGFKSCKKYNICVEDNTYPTAMMVKELKPDTLDGRTWIYYESPVMNINENDAKKYDDSLEKMEKFHNSTQEEFYILSNSILR